MRVRVVVPCKSIHDVEPHCKAGLDEVAALGWEIVFSTGFYVGMNRNDGITRSHKIKQSDFGFDRCLFVDTDIGFTAKQALRLVNSKYDVVGGVYLYRDGGVENYPVAGHWKNGILMQRVKPKAKGYERVGWTGFGFCCVSAKALRKMEYPYFRNQILKSGDEQVECQEDLGFCKECEKYGIPVYIDHSVKLIHKVGANMKLTIQERLEFNKLLPNRGSLVLLGKCKSIRNKVMISKVEAEAVGLKIQQDGRGAVVYRLNAARDKAVDIKLSSSELNILKTQVDALDKAGSIPANMFDLCSKIKDAK